MTNQQGYIDGFQLEFANSVSDDGTTVQLLCLSSSLYVRVVSRL